MSDELKIIANESGTFDITIHCKSEEEQNEVLAKLNAPQPNKWIPVSERLPKEDEWVLITFDDGIEIASLDDDGWCYSSVGNDDWIAEHPPVAWMPLPQPHQPKIPTGAEGSEE